MMRQNTEQAFPFISSQYLKDSLGVDDEISSITVLHRRHSELSSFLLASYHGHKTGPKTECAYSPHMGKEGEHLKKVSI